MSSHCGRWRSALLVGAVLSAVLPDAAANRKHSTHVVGHNHPATFALHTLDEYLLSQQYYPDAVCNDGSPGGFYYSNATIAAKSNLWLVYLQGGGWCYDMQSCTDRLIGNPSLTSSKNGGTRRWPATMQMSGIFDTSAYRSPFAGANLVQIVYCSSDAWIGNIGALDASNSLKGLNNAAGVPGWAFKGQRIVEATLMVLQQYFGLGTLPATQMLLAGCDAGAQGVMYNLDYLNTMLPISGSGVTGVQVKGLLDSATFIDIDPLNPDGVDSLVNQTITAWALYNATGRLGYACMKGYNTLYPDKFPPNELWKCMFGQYRLPYLRTDYIVSQSQFDSWQLDFDAGAKPPFENETLSAYAESFQMATRAALLPLPTSEQPNSGVFSSSCYHHCTLNSDSFWGIYVGDLNLKDYVTTWFFREDSVAQLAVRPSVEAHVTIPEAAQWIEACEGLGCGQCHRRNYSDFALLGSGAAMASGGAAGGRRRSSAFVEAMRNLFLAVVAVVGCMCCFRSAQRIHTAGVELGVIDERKPLLPGAPGGKTA